MADADELLAGDLWHVMQELRCMTEARSLLQSVSEQLDVNGRAALRRAVEGVSEVDCSRIEHLWEEVGTVKKLARG